MRDWIEMRLLPSFAGRILPVDAAVVKLCAPMHVPDPMPIYDALIAATALVRGMRVATRDVKDFASMGVKIVNPFDP